MIFSVTLHDIVHTEKSLTLVFEYLEKDLKQYMDDCGAILAISNVKLFLFQVKPSPVRFNPPMTFLPKSSSSYRILHLPSRYHDFSYISAQSYQLISLYSSLKVVLHHVKTNSSSILIDVFT